jgi:hypothetical protein
MCLLVSQEPSSAASLVGLGDDPMWYDLAPGLLEMAGEDVEADSDVEIVVPLDDRERGRGFPWRLGGQRLNVGLLEVAYLTIDVWVRNPLTFDLRVVIMFPLSFHSI